VFYLFNSPTLNYAFIGCALVLLWLPRSMLRRGARVALAKAEGDTRKAPRGESAEESRDEHDHGVRLRYEFPKFRNWVDFFRALIGGHALMSGVSFLASAANSAVLAPGEALGAIAHASHAPPWIMVQVGVFTVAVWAQMVRREGRLQFFAPVFFLQGLAWPIVGWQVAGLAILGVWSLSPVLRSPAAFLCVQALLLGLLGFLLMPGELIPGAVAAGLAVLPPLVGVLFNRRLTGSFEKKEKVTVRVRQRR
jgi:hypothetical protein